METTFRRQLYSISFTVQAGRVQAQPFHSFPNISAGRVLEWASIIKLNYLHIETGPPAKSSILFPLFFILLLPFSNHLQGLKTHHWCSIPNHRFSSLKTDTPEQAAPTKHSRWKRDRKHSQTEIPPQPQYRTPYRLKTFSQVIQHSSK